MAIIKAQGLSRSFHVGEQRQPVFSNVCLELAAGDFLAITGPSGVGKSTLLSIISGLDKPDSGTVIIQEQNIHALTRSELARFRNRHFGFVFQTPHYIAYKTVFENVMLPFLYCAVPRNQARALVREVLEYVGIAHLADRSPATLSGGELQRMVFARAVVNKPRIIFADEPTGSLDSANSHRVLSLLGREAEKGNVVIMVTHDLEAARQANRQYQLKK